MKPYIYSFSTIFILIGSLLIGCGPKEKPANHNGNNSDSLSTDPEIPKTTTTGSSGVQLIVSANLCKLYQEADPTSAELGRYPQGSVLIYLDEITTFTTPMRIQSVDYDEPWVNADKIEAYVQSLTVNDLAKTAQKYLTKDNHFLFMLKNKPEVE